MTIRTRLVLGYAIGIATTIAVVGGLVWWQMSDALLSTLQSALQTRSDAVLASLENQGQSGLQESDDPNVATWVVLADQHGQPIDASVGAPAAVPLTAGSMVADGHRYLTRVDRAPDGTYVVTGADLARVEAAQAALARIIVGVGGLVGAASLFLAWLLAGRALRPIERLITDADDLRPDDLDRRLAVPRTTDEVGRLAATLNRMLDRISDSVARQRLFVALASHELRTPLAALRAELDVADGDNTSVAEYRAAIREARVDAVRLGSLTAGLLELAKVGDEARPVARTPVSVSDLASSALRAVEPLVAQWAASVTVHAPNVVVLVDRTRIEQALVNMLSNAIVHSLAAPQVEFNADVIGQGREALLSLSVLDRGPGFGPEDPVELFSPFRRGSLAIAAGSGLGLALVANAARVHGGAVQAANRTGGGAIVTLSIPVGAREGFAVPALGSVG